MTTYANQKIVTIHKEKYLQEFLQVGKDEWMTAYDKLPRGAFGLYLYLCGNMNNYRLGLSSAAIQQALKVSDSTYRRAIESLLEEGYLIQSGNDKNLHFYPKPQPTNYVKKSSKKKTAAALDTDAPALATEPDDDEPDYDFSSYSSTSEYGWN